jgi:hypothetical protein
VACAYVFSQVQGNKAVHCHSYSGVQQLLVLQKCVCVCVLCSHLFPTLPSWIANLVIAGGFSGARANKWYQSRVTRA